MKIAIVGGGLTGLVAGYRLSQEGHKITVFEKEKELGGLAGGFEINGTNLEKTYHHIFRKDKDYIALVKELGLIDKLVWRKDVTAIYYDSQVYPFAGAVDLFRFKPLGLMDKLRLGLVKIYLEKERNWKKFEKVTAAEWMEKWCGRRAYKVVWEPLLRGKFNDRYRDVSMAWMWARIHTRGSGGLGYLMGGFQQVTDELAKRIKANGGAIKLGTELKEEKNFDKIITSAPIKRIDYLPAVCLVFTSKQNLSKYYWHNINDTQSPFLAFIQHTNFIDKENYGGDNVYYLGAYGKTKVDEKEWFDYLKKIFPSFGIEKVEQKSIFSFKYAQHVVSTGYKVPEMKLNKKTYQVNFARIYPEDRGMNFAVREGEIVADIINNEG